MKISTPQNYQSYSIIILVQTSDGNRDLSGGQRVFMTNTPYFGLRYVDKVVGVHDVMGHSAT